MLGYLKATTSCSNNDATQRRSIARLCDRYPDIGEAWDRGRIGRAQVLELDKAYANPRAREWFGEFLPILLDDAEQFCHKDFTLCIKKFVTTADADGAHDDRDHAIQHRNAHVVVNGSELDVSVIGGDPIVAAETTGVFQRFVDAEYHINVASTPAST